MPFDLSTAKPVTESGGFDLSTAKPVEKQEDTSYDVSEYDAKKKTAGKEESRTERLTRLAKQAHQEAEAEPIASGPLPIPPSVGKGVLESGMQMLTGAIATPIAGLAGSAQGLYNLATGNEKTSAGSRVQKVQHALTYEPKTSAGKLISELASTPMSLASEYAGEKLGKTLSEDASVWGGLVGGKEGRKKGAEWGEAAGTSIGEAAIPIAATLAGGKAVLSRPPKAATRDTLEGVGSARVPMEDLRQARANELPIPIQLTKGQASREAMQQKFEKETAKLPEGAPLRERMSQQNEAILSNFDSWIDSTGASKTELRPIGEVVNKVVVDKAKKAKGEINKAYNEAREAGHMADNVDYSPLKAIIEEQGPTTREKLAPILNAVSEQIAKNDPKGTGSMSINALEDIRKLINKTSEPGTPNGVFGTEFKKAIDTATENAGGDLYRSARRMRENYAKEFEDRGVIAKMLRNKPGTADRAVAMEDVFDHSIMKGSLDDVRAVRRTLQTAGDEGKQAWKELQGQTIRNIKDEMTKSVAVDEKGNRVVSTAQLDKMVRKLDEDGKLDFIFGKKGAEQIRNVNDIAKDVFTAPPSAGVNYSNTASVLIGLLDTAVSGTAGLPLPIGSTLNYGVKKLKSRNLSKKVEEALGNTPEPQTPAFRMDGRPNLTPVDAVPSVISEEQRKAAAP